MGFRILQNESRVLDDSITRQVWVEYWAAPVADFSASFEAGNGGVGTYIASGLPTEGMEVTTGNGFSATITNAYVQEVKVYPAQVAGEYIVSIVCQLLKTA